MKRKLMLLLTCLFVGIGLVTAQTSKISGVVTSEEDGEPVVGASVLVKGSAIGSITDIDGKFTISNVPASAKTLQVSFIGMTTQNVAIKPGVIKIALKPVAESLDEVVVTAQGLTRQEKSLGYSTQKISGDKLTTARQTDLGNAMAGKIAGARFFGASGATFDSGTIVLRGTTDFTSIAGSEPIYVVDGSITNKNSVNMDDVASINVLKGAAATALYGSQGGNGAVIITTKQAKEGKGGIEVSHTLQWESYYNHFNLQKEYGGGSLGYQGEVDDAKYGSQYDTMSPEYLYGTVKNYVNSDGSYYYDYYSDESWGARFNPSVKMASALYFDETSSKYGVADPYVARLNLGDLYRTGVTNTTNVAFSKAGKDYTSRISFTNSSRDGIQPNSDAVRRFLSVKTSFKPATWMNVSLDYKYTYRRNHNAAQEGYGGERNVTSEYLQWGQTSVNMKDYKNYRRADGSWRTWNIVAPDDLSANFHDNPYAVLDNANVYTTDQWNVFTGDAEIILPYKFKAGIRVMGNMKNNNEETKYANGSINFQSKYAENQYHTRDLTVQGRLTWGDRFVNNRLSVDAAVFAEERNYNYGILKTNTNGGLTINDYYNLAGSASYVTATNEEQHFKERSLFGTATIGLDDTYYLDGALRNDWSSKLPASGNSYLYGGLSGSVIFSNFLKEATWLNYWKVRASLAQVGSSLDVYKTLPVYETGDKYNSKITLYQSATQLNQSIKPTISTTYEVGTEFRMFDRRFWGDINLYQRDSKNQIINVTVAPQSGYSSRQMNAGLVRNKGIEISLGGTPVKTNNFQWDIEGNISKNKNKLIRLNEDIQQYTLEGNRFVYNWYLKAQVGKPIGVITTMARAARNEDGQLLLKPTTSAAWGGGYQLTYETNVEKEAGNFQPDWTGGFSTSVRYKDFRLSADFDFMIGGQMVSWTNLWANGSGTAAETSYINNKGVNVREGISKGGGVYVKGVDSTTGKEVTAYMNAYNYFHYEANYDNDAWIYDRTYVKLRELSLSYTVPTSLLSKANIGLNSASVSFVASNPWLIYSACPNVDPSEAGKNWIEGGQAPSTRSFGLTVKLSF